MALTICVEISCFLNYLSDPESLTFVQYTFLVEICKDQLRCDNTTKNIIFRSNNKQQKKFSQYKKVFQWERNHKMCTLTFFVSFSTSPMRFNDIKLKITLMQFNPFY